MNTDNHNDRNNNTVFLAAMFPLLVAVVAVVYESSAVTWTVIALGTVGLLFLLSRHLRTRR